VRTGLPIRDNRRTGGSSPVEFAWRVHGALENWTAKVDMKASILLAFQGGAFIFATTSREIVLGTADRRPLVTAALGVVLLVSSMAAAAAAILPALGSARQHRLDRTREWIYFGHVRLWDATELAARLARLSERDEVQALSAQLVRMSRLNWRKHRLLQASVVLTVMSMVVMMAAVALRVGG
jgi:pycsar effector protein